VVDTVGAVPQNDEAIHGWRRGPVAVTGASGQVGTPLRRRLGQLPNEVRPLGRDDDLAAAFGEADAVVHLAGTLQPHKPNTYRAANHETAVATAAALAHLQAQRVVFLSFLGARLDASNSYLRYKAEAEDALRSSGTPAVISGAITSTALPASPARPPRRSLRSPAKSRCSAVGHNSWLRCTGTMLWKRSFTPRSIPTL